MSNPFQELWQEFQSAPPLGKALVIATFGVVAGIGLYVGISKQKSATGTATTLPIDTSVDASGSTGAPPFANMPALPVSPDAPIIGALNIPRPVTKLPVVKVNEDDTLAKIAHYAYGTSTSSAIQTILSANPGLQNGDLTPGSYLMIPHAKGTVRVKATEGDTLGTLSHYAYGTTGAIDKIIRANKLSNGLGADYRLTPGRVYSIPR